MGHKLQKFSRGPPLHNPPTNLFVENYIKNGGKVLKNASFWVINSKNFRGGSSDPPCRRSGLRPARRKLVRRGKKMISKRGGGEMIELDNIYPWGWLICIVHCVDESELSCHSHPPPPSFEIIFIPDGRPPREKTWSL